MRVPKTLIKRQLAEKRRKKKRGKKTKASHKSKQTHRIDTYDWKQPPGRINRFDGFQVYGWQSKEQAAWYRKACKNITDGVVVEIGVYGGLSLLSVVGICAERGTKIYGIDQWDLISEVNGKLIRGARLARCRQIMEDVLENLRSIIDQFGYKNVELVKEFSIEAAKQFNDESVDLIYIDAGHDYMSVMADLENWYPKLKPGCMIWGDDFSWVGVRSAVKDFTKEHGIQHKTFKPRSWYFIKQ